MNFYLLKIKVCTKINIELLKLRLLLLLLKFDLNNVIHK